MFLWRAELSCKNHGLTIQTLSCVVVISSCKRDCQFFVPHTTFQLESDKISQLLAPQYDDWPKYSLCLIKILFPPYLISPSLLVQIRRIVQGKRWMLKVMIVEDNIFFRGIFRDWLLTQYSSTEVIEAGSGEEAFKSLRSNVFDLVFIDIHLPGENGLEITRKVKAGWQDLPVITIISYDIPEYREAAIRYGANSFIAKDSLKWDEISKLIRCFQAAKQNGRKPTCLRFTSG